MDYETPKLVKLNELDNLAQGVICSTGTAAEGGDGCIDGNGAAGVIGCANGDSANKCTVGTGD